MEHSTVIHLIFKFIMLQKLQYLMQNTFTMNNIQGQCATWSEMSTITHMENIKGHV